MKTNKTVEYGLRVMRAGTMTFYSAERFNSLADARVAARRLARKSEHYPDGNYVEVRKLETIVNETMIDRFEAGDN